MVRSYSRMTGQTSVEMNTNRSGRHALQDRLRRAAHARGCGRRCRNATTMPCTPASRAPRPPRDAPPADRAASARCRRRGCVRDAEDAVARNKLIRPGAEQRLHLRHPQPREFDHVLEFRGREQASSAPLRWITVLMPTVVPWTKSLTAPGVMPCRASSRASPFITSCPGFSGVVSTFSVCRRFAAVIQDAEIDEGAADIDTDAPGHRLAADR